MNSESPEYKRALQAVESLEPPALGFIKPAEFRAGLPTASAAIQKQNNTIIQLLLQLFEKVNSLQAEVRTLRKEPELPEEILDQITSKFNKLSITEAPSEPRGKILVHKDPVKIFEEEKLKL